MSTQYVKLHGSILNSSLWLEDDETRLVFITMLAMADWNGFVAASIGGLAHRARVDRDDCLKALKVLLSPDPDSRDGTTGERIEKVQGGWVVLNHRRYRDMRSLKQVQAAERAKKRRAKILGPAPPESERSVTQRDGGRARQSSRTDPDPDRDPDQKQTPNRTAKDLEPRVADPVPKASANESAAAVENGDRAARLPPADVSAPEPTEQADPAVKTLQAVLSRHEKAKKHGLDSESFAMEVYGLVLPFAHNMEREDYERAILEALAHTPASSTETYMRKMITSYVLQVARKPIGERRHRVTKAAEKREAKASARARASSAPPEFPPEPEALGDVLDATTLAKQAKAWAANNTRGPAPAEATEEAS